ncbi:MAG: hypothetical protein ABI036_16135 [Fibrobacteria bacterium]
MKVPFPSWHVRPPAMIAAPFERAVSTCASMALADSNPFHDSKFMKSKPNSGHAHPGR